MTLGAPDSIGHLIPSQEKLTPRWLHDVGLGGYVTLATAVAAFPLPIVDRALKRSVQERLVRKIATHYGIELSASSVAVLADDERKESLPLPVHHALTMTFRRLRPLRWGGRVVAILTLKRALDVAVDLGQRTYLLEVAAQRGWLSAHRSFGAAEVRRAVEAACDEKGRTAGRKAWEALRRLARNVQLRPSPVDPVPWKRPRSLVAAFEDALLRDVAPIEPLGRHVSPPKGNDGPLSDPFSHPIGATYL